MNIDKRRNYILMIDTETAGDFGSPMVYDCGFAVVDKHGNVYETGSYVISNIFIYRKDLMRSAYYASKIPSYWQDIWAKKRKVIAFSQLRTILYDVIQKYDCKQYCAHNAGFDERALNATLKYATHGRETQFFPSTIAKWDTMLMAKSVICEMPSYDKFCRANGYVTKHKPPRLQTNAEVLYRFISKDITFAEEHRGLDDVMIEMQILVYCYRQHKKMRVC